MGLFSRKPKYPAVVSVNFRSLTSDEPFNPGGAYSYRWGLDYPPQVGLRVWVPGYDGRPAPAVIIALNGSGSHDVTQSVLGVVSQQELDAALTFSPEARWISICRFVAGLSVPPESVIVPEGFPKVAPSSGEASAEVASQYGSMWWRAYKVAQELGLPESEVERFHEIALRWYSIRDKG